MDQGRLAATMLRRTRIARQFPLHGDDVGFDPPALILVRRLEIGLAQNGADAVAESGNEPGV